MALKNEKSTKEKSQHCTTQNLRSAQFEMALSKLLRPNDTWPEVLKRFVPPQCYAGQSHPTN